MRRLPARASLSRRWSSVPSASAPRPPATSSAPSSTTGGGALPGVTVEGARPVLPGRAERGHRRERRLPPGSPAARDVYKVTAALPGVRPRGAAGRRRARRRPQRRTSGCGPAVHGRDPRHRRGPARRHDLDDDRRQHRQPADQLACPTGRNYASIVAGLPGRLARRRPTPRTSPTRSSIYGSTGLENSFIIDGVNTTGVEYGFQGKELNFEFIQEVDVKTGGYQAEFGRSTGGIINVITKSGGNEFHGDVFGYYDADSLQAANKHPDDSNLYGTVASGSRRHDYGFDLGGYSVKDRLWFFGAYDRVKNTSTSE